MRCKSPYYQKDLKILVPCGKCLFCRISKKNKWTARLVLEKASHRDACFVTLTYDDLNLPLDGSVSKRELQLFLKRLRKEIYPHKIRYYACGEYGDLHLRPHYHLILFGLPKNPMVEAIISKTWNKGRIQVDQCENASMRYVAGYVAKKYSSDKEERIGSDLTKEFALMSRRPALGTDAIKYFADLAFTQNPYDVISCFRSEGRNLPLDRTMRNKLREAVMTPEEIEHIKSLRIDLMREELKELIKDELGEYEALMFERANIKGIDKHYANLAHDVAHSEDLSVEERWINRRNKRKDL